MAPENETTKPVEAAYRAVNAQTPPKPEEAKPEAKPEAKAEVKPEAAPVKDAKPKDAANGKKRMLKPKNAGELGLYYIVAGVACCIMAFVGNFLMGVVISPIIAFAIGLFIILIIHYIDLLQTYGV